jgi:hypothetical protein
MPLRYRHIGFSLSVSCQWLAAFLTVYAGPIAIADPNVSWKTWIWFFVFNAIAVPYGTSRATLTCHIIRSDHFQFASRRLLDSTDKNSQSITAVPKPEGIRWSK